MVFDEYPHGNRDMPLYFLRKLYAEFMLGKHVNYIDILEFQGVARGMPQNKEHARDDPNRLHPSLYPRNPPHLYPASSSVFDQTQDALLQLSETLL